MEDPWRMEDRENTFPAVTDWISGARVESGRRSLSEDSFLLRGSRFHPSGSGEYHFAWWGNLGRMGFGGGG